jgi:DNA-binding NtrC family response regulator/Flp pilus assembly protein TadD
MKNGTSQHTLEAIQALIESGQIDEALQDLDDYLIEHHEDTFAHYLMGIALFEKGDIKGALEAYQQVQRAHPKMPELKVNLAYVLAASGQIEQAEQLFDQAGVADPQNVKIKNGLLQIYIQTGRLEAAREIWEQLSEQDPDNPELNFLSSTVSLMEGQIPNAFRDLEKALSKDADNPRYNFNYGFACYTVGRHEEAVASLQKFWSSDPAKVADFVYGNSQTLFKRIQVLARQNQRLRASIEDQTIMGVSSIMKAFRRRLRNIQTKDVTVLLQGETGTGKEVFAKEIHRGSLRKEGPFIPVNISAVNSSLMESELFGHKKGAFTDAHEDRVGLFEAANGGTIFLDEIAEMDASAQAKVLRVLEERKVRRTGENTETEIDVRIIAATKEDLWKRVQAGTFREDLYYRLKVVTFELPPLRARREDIPIFADAFLDRFAQHHQVDTEGFTQEAMDLIQKCDWPGNVRELRNVVESLVCETESDRIDVKGLPKEMKENAERAQVLSALEQAKWNVKKAAEIHGIQRESMQRKMKRLGISKSDPIS